LEVDRLGKLKHSGISQTKMRLALLVLLLVAFSTLGLCQTANLLVRADHDCRLSIDGQSRGTLRAGDSVRVNLPLGEHRVEASPLPDGPHWEGSVTLTEPDGQQFNIPLQAAIISAKAQRLGYWTDTATGLTWAIADNAFGVSWTQAAGYCRSLTLGEYKDWTLPGIDDLQRLFGGEANQSGRHVKGPIQITGWEWSSTPGREPGEQWALDFGDGGRASVVTGDSGLNRALCVRRAGAER
jgi:Protein of unknown function (DUF1566)